MTNIAGLRERAARFRAHAGEYDPSVARPLLDQARELEWEAAALERKGRERRQPPLTLRQMRLLPARRVFGRRGAPAA
ncbi:MAG TPA: hypothetical protein VGD66_04455 [Allosphingosinicella sp.]|jgi:hypothetical protein